MLLAVMILMVGVTSAQVPSATMTPPETTNPNMKQTGLGTTQPYKKTTHFKQTSTRPPSSTVSEDRVFSTVSEEISGVTATIPIKSTFQPKPTPDSTAISVYKNTTISLSSVARSTYPSTRGTLEDPARRSARRFSTHVITTMELPTTPFPQSSSNTNIQRKSSEDSQTAHDFSTSTSSIHPTKPFPVSTYEAPIESIYPTKPFPVSAYQAPTESIHTTKRFPMSSYQDPTESIHIKPYSLSSYQTPTVSLAENSTFRRENVNYPTIITATGYQKSKAETRRKPTTSVPLAQDFISKAESVVLEKHRTQEISTTFKNAPTASSQHKKATQLINSRSPPTSKTVLTSPPPPVPTAPLPSEVQKHTIVPPNTVESMHNLPWIKHETTPVFSGNELDNILHPTFPSVFYRRPTKPLKTGRNRDMKEPTTTLSPVTIASSPLLKDNERNPDYYFYKTSVSGQAVTTVSLQTTVSTTPDLNLVTNHSALFTPLPIRGASAHNLKITPSVPQLHLETSENKSALQFTSFSTGSPATYNPRVPPSTSQRLLETIKNQPVPHSSSFPIEGRGRDNPKTPPSAPIRLLKTFENPSAPQSALFPTVDPAIHNPKTPSKLPQLPPETSRNQSAPFPFAVASKLKPKVPVITSSLPLKISRPSPPEILPTLAAIDSVIENVTQNCSNDYCVSDEDYIDMMLEYMFPTTYEWVLIGMHIIVFIGGLVGNALVCVAVYRNHSMRTVTNYFIVNLAVADFLVIFLCLPPTVLWDVTETWFMGTALCKIVLYFQTVSVAVSVLTLTFISVDRWYAICCPLKFKSTTARAKTAILVIWVLALAFDVPELVVLQTKRKELNIDTLFFTQCEPSWSDKTDMAFHCLQTVLLYTLPLVFMSIAYCQIVRVLWSSRNIPGHKERLDSSVTNGQAVTSRSDTIDRRKAYTRCTSVTVSTTGQVIGRRKAAKMLVAVVIMFAVCYFPVHLLSILRYTLDLPQTDATTAFAMVSHWLCYANSAVNPLIYNFMSGKFRKEFAHTFGCRRISWKRAAALARRRRRRQPETPSGDWQGNGRCRPQRTEMVPLSGGGATNIVTDVELPC